MVAAAARGVVRVPLVGALGAAVILLRATGAPEDHSMCMALERASVGSPRRRREASALWTALDQPDLALQAVEGAEPTPRVESLRGRALQRAGDLASAVDALHRAGLPRQRWRSRRWERRVRGRLAVLDETWQPGGRPRGGRRAAPVPGRVLHLATNSLPYVQAGYTIRLHQVVRAQRDAGLDPHVVTKLGFPLLEGRLRTPAEEWVDGVAHHRLLPRRVLATSPDLFLRQNVEEAARVVAAVRPAVLHAASNHHNGRVALALRDQFAIPVVYEVRGFLEETWVAERGPAAEDTDFYRRTRAIETWCMQQADHVVTLGDVMRVEIEGRGIPAERITIVPNAVEERFLVPPPESAGLRARFRIPAGTPTIGYVSSLSPYEGVEVLLRATARLLGAGTSVHCLVVGDGVAGPALRDIVRALGIERHVTFTGRVPHADVVAYYAAIDVFVVPRLNHQVCRLVTPLKPFEAMALGRAVVVSDIPALAEMVDDGVTGRRVTPGDPAALAAVLTTLLGDPQTRARLGGAARAFVKDRRTWRSNGQRYRDVYDRLGVLDG